MITARLCSTATPEWDRFVDTHPEASLYHRSRWLDLVETVFGHEVQRWALRDPAGGITGVLPIVRLKSRLFGDFGVSLPFVNYGGVLAASPADHATLVAAATRHAAATGLEHIEFRDRRPCEGFAAVRADKVIMKRELPGSADMLWKDLGSKLRAQVRRPEREGVQVEIGRGELLSAFYRVFARNMRDLGTPVYARSFFSAILAAEPAAAIVVVRVGGEPAAAALLLGYRECMEIPWASSIRKYNAVGVNMLLYWHCLKHAIASGHTVFDFGRSSIDSGTCRFKRQWGAAPVPCYWHYWLRQHQEMPALNPENSKYRLAIGVWQRLPLAVTNLIGPRIVRSLP